MSRLRFHHGRQHRVVGFNQLLRFFRPFTGPGIGVVIFRHEFAVIWESEPSR